MDGIDTLALQGVVRELPYRAVFATVSGAHLYGFPSPDSDYDLRGAFILPLEAVIGLDRPTETVTDSCERDGRQVDLVVHDMKKYLALLLNKNGYVLEQIYSPLVVLGGPAFDELRLLARGAITRHVYHHYQGFSSAELGRFESESPRRVKRLLYVYRVLLTGIHLLETGEVEASLPRLNERFRLPFIADLIAQKQQEKGLFLGGDLEMHTDAIARLRRRLEEAFLGSRLAEAASNRAALSSYLVRLRLEMRDG